GFCPGRPCDLPGGGHEFCPATVTSSAQGRPPARPQSQVLPRGGPAATGSGVVGSGGGSSGGGAGNEEGSPGRILASPPAAVQRLSTAYWAWSSVNWSP